MALLAELMHSLIGGAIHLCLGVILGLALARVMRLRQLHWGWSACALAFVLPLGHVFAGIQITLVVALFLGMWLGRRWHREDLDAGADLARQALLRRTPLAVGGRLLERLLPASRVSRASGWWRGEEMVIGRDREGHSVSMRLGGCTGGTHTLVVGAAGSGKTVTETWIALRAIERGLGAIVLDPKNDPQMRAAIRRAGEQAGRPFFEWTQRALRCTTRTRGAVRSEIADKVLAAERFTEPHYQRQAQRYLGHAIRTIRSAGLQVSLAALVRTLDPAQLELLARELPSAQGADVHAYLDSLTARQSRDLAGVRDRLAIMAESDPRAARSSRDWRPSGRSRNARGGGQKLEVGLAVPASEADHGPLLAQMLGAAIVWGLPEPPLQALQGRPVPSLVVIDEFSASWQPERVVRLFGRARGVGWNEPSCWEPGRLADLRPART